MVGTIGPVVHGRRTRYPRWSCLLLFVVAHAAGGVLTGIALALPVATLNRFHPLDASRIAPGLLTLCAFGIAREAGLVRFHVPTSTWQVPRRWSLLPIGVMSILYGLILGSGLFTRIGSSCYYVIVVACVFSGDPVLGASVFASYAVAKALAVVFMTELYLKTRRKSGNVIASTAEIAVRVPLASATALAIFSGLIAMMYLPGHWRAPLPW
jgi:hypothetical protein